MGKVLKVREVGDPILEKQCDEVNITNNNEDIIDIIEDLKSTLEYGTGLGIAAPQIGVDKRIIVVGSKKENIKYNDAEEIPITAMINPTWKKLTEDTDVQYEGCMSVPSIRGKVERYKNIELTYYNENGEKIVKKLKKLIVKIELIWYYYIVQFFGEIAQLARATGSYPVGRWFESISRYQ